MYEHVQESRELIVKSLAYSEFFSSTNDKEVILENYSKAKQACKDALQQLTKIRNANTQLKKNGQNLSLVEAISIWRDQLNCLIQEEKMQTMVDNGILPIYIFDVIKREVFEKEKDVN